METLTLVLSTVEIMAMGGIARLLLPYLIRAAGYPGNKVAGDFQRKDRDHWQIAGTVLSFLGQATIALLYVSWITDFTHGAVREVWDWGWLLWGPACWAIWAPTRASFATNRELRKKEPGQWVTGAVYLAGLFMPMVFLVGFFVFAANAGANRWLAPWMWFLK